MRAVAALIAGALAALTPLSAAESPSSGSIYELDITLTDQSGAARALDSLRGEVVLVTMFYTSCPMACPLQVDTLRTIEGSLSATQREQIRVLMVSVDPERDTTSVLADLARKRRIDLKRWTLARAEPADVRLFASVLNIQYRKLPDGEFNHTSVITVLNRKGEIVKQSSVLGRADAALVQSVQANLAAKS